MIVPLKGLLFYVVVPRHHRPASATVDKFLPWTTWYRFISVGRLWSELCFQLVHVIGLVMFTSIFCLTTQWPPLWLCTLSMLSPSVPGIRHSPIPGLFVLVLDIHILGMWPKWRLHSCFHMYCARVGWRWLDAILSMYLHADCGIHSSCSCDMMLTLRGFQILESFAF